MSFSNVGDAQHPVTPIGHGGKRALELEVEQLLASPRSSSSPRTSSRTFSGSLLFSRGNRSKKASNERRSFSSETICESRGRKFARAALTRGNSAARRMLRGASSPISCWLSSLLALVLFSLFFNGFEEHYITGFFGNLGSVQDKSTVTPVSQQQQSGEVVSSKEKYASQVSTDVPINKISTQPPIVVDPKAPYVSVNDHHQMHHAAPTSNNSTTMQMRANSFTTWLDFDEKDPKPSTNPVVPDNPKKFVEMWCELDEKSEPWQPKDSWHQRAPAFLLPGASHSGIQYLTQALHDHPSIVKTVTKQVHFFVDRPFNKFVTRSEKTLVKQARASMYLRHYALTELKKNESLIAFDASPGYLYHSSQVPRRLLCVIPWVKLVILLRNPVDRVLEHYAAEQKRGLKLKLEDWIDQDMALMKAVKLISTNSTVSANNNNTAEDVAWLSYQKKSVAGQLGRSLYAIQIRQWIKAFSRAGRTPDILLIRTDHLALNPDDQYQRILNFLGLPPVKLKRDTLPIEITHQIHPVSNATRTFLEDFFRPYNRKLKALIRRYNLSVD